MNTDMIPRRRKGVAFRRVEEEGIAMVAETAEVHVLNEVGCRVMELVDGHRSVADIILTLKQEYEVSEKEVNESVISFLGEAQQAKLIQLTE